jgi:amidohydrolase
MIKSLGSLCAALLSLVISARMCLADEILQRVNLLAEEATEQVVEWRRDFHAHPELANREERTARIVAERLREMGVDEIRTGVAHHGVVALIHGRKPGPCVALRADMDALPIPEQTDLPFTSQNKGVMHACGHDAHTAMLLGAAWVLSRMRDVMPGAVKLIFQPAEEGAPPGEDGGAKMMIAEGVLQDPEVSAVFGMHISPDLEAGKISYRFGGLLASVDRFRVTISGKQSHAATPWKGIDPIVASAQIVSAVQTIASRRIDARQPIVVSFGMIHGGQAWNIIPDSVELEGTIRTHEAEVRRQAVREFNRIVQHTANGLGCQVEIEMSDYGPVVWNDPKLGAKTRPSLLRAAGESNVVEALPVMVGEDFAHYARRVPGCFIFLGVRNESMGAVHALHTPQLVIDESALPLGVRAHALMALDYLRRESTGIPGN